MGQSHSSRIPCLLDRTDRGKSSRTDLQQYVGWGSVLRHWTNLVITVIFLHCWLLLSIQSVDRVHDTPPQWKIAGVLYIPAHRSWRWPEAAGSSCVSECNWRWTRPFQNDPLLPDIHKQRHFSSRPEYTHQQKAQGYIQSVLIKKLKEFWLEIRTHWCQRQIYSKEISYSRSSTAICCCTTGMKSYLYLHTDS